MKKIVLTVAVAFLGTSMMAQINGIKQTLTSEQATSLMKQNSVRCASQTPPKSWDDWFNTQVENYTKALQTGKSSITTYTIPVVFHIIKSSSEAVGTGHNVSQAQVNSQIPILNADYGGTGYNTSQYASMTLDRKSVV